MMNIKRLYARMVIVTLLLSCAVLLCPSESYASATDGIKTPFSKIQSEQLTILENNNNSLALKLEELKMELEMLQQPQAQLVQELRTAEELLNKTRKELHTSLISLENAKQLQTQTEESLNRLESQINKLMAEKKRYRKQRNVAVIVATVAVAFAAKKSHIV